MRKSAVLLAASLVIGICSVDSAVSVGCTANTTYISGYTVVTFTGAGSCTWSTPAGISTVDVLIVGGGGGGGYNTGGGGSGGGVDSATARAVSGTVNITVGAGGAGANSSGSTPSSGSLTSFGTFQVAGGNPGTNYPPAPAPGGTSVSGSGAGGQSATTSGVNAQNGFAGPTSLITGTLTNYAGGGGGGGWNSPSAASGGLGGGGTGATNGAGSNGTDGLGGGGGGGAAPGYAAGNGGSGVVIIRYAGSTGDFTTGKNATGFYRGAITFVVTVYSPGKVTFYAKLKVIPGCSRVTTTGAGPYTATCSYKANVHGVVPITARLFPDSSPGTSVLISGGTASVTARSGKR